ncbi:hypothetical protein HPG69_006990 [Diceros bicornis minor]|uniref:HotDog ACOT-type domain-containing protein n=1 Tax=Diceros bicornis minor TaxID=77932 RepID=A0A7J7EPM0_DICBM|nr:hypothetical protein HPG69_006990 [Diceros bicornis minor]
MWKVLFPSLGAIKPFGAPSPLLRLSLFTSDILPRGFILLSPLPRIMRPDDANVAGNVHGGTILKMIEEAGAIISTRHCNSQNGERCVAALARVERTDFLSPMCIGEVAHVSAGITYTSKHSVEVQVNVMSENILTGTKKLTNKATLWYVPLSLKNVDKVLEVPPVVYSRQEQEEEGRKRYEAQKLERMETKWRNGDIVQPVLNPEPNTVSYSQSSLIHLVGPSDCTLHGFVHGGKKQVALAPPCAFTGSSSAPGSHAPI